MIVCGHIAVEPFQAQVWLSIRASGLNGFHAYTKCIQNRDWITVHEVHVELSFTVKRTFTRTMSVV